MAQTMDNEISRSPHGCTKPTGIFSDFLRFHFSPQAHPSISFSCADKLVWCFADDIFREGELAIAYPCLGCRGGLTLFLAYLTQCVLTDTPGRPFDPVLVYPGTTDIRESYMDLKIKVKDLLDVLRNARIRALSRGGSPCVYPWEEKLFNRLRRKRIDYSDEFPLHDFFPAAVLDGDSAPHLLGGRHGFGRGDDSPSPLHFAVKIHHVSSDERYKAAFLMHDSLTTHAERRRLTENLHRVRAKVLVHLFESPFSPNFRKLVKRNVKSWRIRPSDFPEDGELFLEDKEVLDMMDSEPRIHILPPPLAEESLQVLYDNFRHLRKSAGRDKTVGEIYQRIYNLYRFFLTLPVPIEDYDSIAKDFGHATVLERLKDILDEMPVLNPSDYAYFDDSLQKIHSMVERLKEDPFRSRAILTEVRRALDKRQRIGIAVSYVLFGSAIEKFLARSLETDPMLLPHLGVYVVHIGSLRALEPDRIFDVLVFPSYRGGNTLRWVMSGKGKDAIVISTEGERRAMARDFRDGTKMSNTWSPQPKGPPMPLDENPEDKLAEALQDVRPDLPTFPLDDEEFVQGLLNHTPIKHPDPSRLSGHIRCLRINFAGLCAYLPEEGAVTVIGKRGTVERGVKDLKPGDKVLFINHAQSRTIYEVMLDEIKRSSGFEEHVAIIQQWQRRLQAWFVNSNLSFSSLHNLLSRKGSSVVGATVASWVRGNTMAPMDPKNLKLLIEMVGIQDSEGTVCKTVNEAACRLRTVYRVYARVVNSFLIKAVGEDRPEVDDLLQKYNLDIGAIRDSVTKEEVVAVSRETICVSPRIAGRLYEN